MKKVLVPFSVFLPVFLVVSGIISCASPPPPPPLPPASIPTPEPLPEAPAPEPEPDPPAPDTAGPELNVGFSTRYFSPDGDGVEDELTVSIDVKDESAVASWHVEIREPYDPYPLFSEWGGEGSPPAEIVWDGRSASGELVQSASDYPFKLTVTDVLGNVSVFEGLIEVDVLVIREANGVLRVQVPSIVFGANAGNFDGLDAETVARNDEILRRIAQVLNKFSAYKVKVEGHANPVGRTARERQREQETDLALSDMRARYVVDYLGKLGVARNRLTPYGVGNVRPIANIEDRNNWWKNRRVEFILQK
jgi:outer membrane protein OmpA-like peptidoglycan-associated protein